MGEIIWICVFFIVILNFASLVYISWRHSKTLKKLSGYAGKDAKKKKLKASLVDIENKRHIMLFLCLVCLFTSILYYERWKESMVPFGDKRSVSNKDVSQGLQYLSDKYYSSWSNDKEGPLLAGLLGVQVEIVHQTYSKSKNKADFLRKIGDEFVARNG